MSGQFSIPLLLFKTERLQEVNLTSDANYIKLHYCLKLMNKTIKTSNIIY